jgi:hypothetical protein
MTITQEDIDEDSSMLLCDLYTHTTYALFPSDQAFQIFLWDVSPSSSAY